MNANFRHTFRYDNACQAAAAPECITANARHIFRYSDTRQTAAFEECVIANGRYALWDSDARQASAAIEFASRFISTTCVLNGRKMSTWIL